MTETEFKIVEQMIENRLRGHMNQLYKELNKRADSMPVDKSSEAEALRFVASTLIWHNWSNEAAHGN